MKQKNEIKLLVRGLGKKANNCVDLVLPNNDESSLKETLEKVCDENNSLCNIIKSTNNCKIKLDDNIDVLELNKKLLELNELASPGEITAVSEYLDMKKSGYEDYICKNYEGVSIDEIIDKVKAKDYKFYTNKEYLDRYDIYDIYDQLVLSHNEKNEIIARLDEKEDILERFTTSEIVNLFDDDELVEFFADDDYCIATSTGAIEETKQSITTLNIPPTILEILDSNKIKTLDELTNKSEFELIKLNLNQLQTNEIEIALKEKGLKLKENV